MERKAVRQTMGRGCRYDSVLDTVGDTPTIRVNNLGPGGVRLYVKAEFFNPAASVRDRLALNIVEAAERDGRLKPGQTVVEATSGNIGIGLAMVCAQKGYPLVVTMADRVKSYSCWKFGGVHPLRMRIANGLWRARQRSTPWQQEYLLRSAPVKS